MSSPGDTLYVYQYQRAFLAFGATGASGQFKFQQESLTLNDAVGKAGGLLDNRADPGEVLVYRLEKRATLDHMGVDLSALAVEQDDIPTIYRVNLRDPSGFFAAARSRCATATSSTSTTPTGRDREVPRHADQLHQFGFGHGERRGQRQGGDPLSAEPLRPGELSMREGAKVA